jgi:hypothetical protein
MPLSRISTQERNRRFPALANQIAEKIRSSSLPVTKIKAGTTVFRKVQTARTSIVDYAGRVIDDPRFQDLNSFWKPSQSDLLRIGPDAPRKDHRWSGILPNGSPGIGGSYWGTIHGVLAEDFFYNVKKNFTPPKSRFIDSKYAPLVLNGRSRLEKYIAEIPTMIPVNGGHLSDILIGTLKQDCQVLEMHPGSEWFCEWNKQLSHVLKEPISTMGYETIADWMFDPTDRLMSRLVANIGSDCNETGVFAASARAEDLNWSSGFREDLANNLALFGGARQSISNLISLEAILEIRPSPNEGTVTAKINQIGNAYPKTAANGLVDQHGKPYSG